MILLAVIALALAQTATCLIIEDFQMRQNESLHWGTYRPNLYFGMRTRSEEEFMTGLMWSTLGSYDGGNEIRHSCEMSDGLKYNWKYHDGRQFGSQIIQDLKLQFQLQTDFIKFQSGSAWMSRVFTKGLKAPLSLMLYFVSGEDFTLSSDDSSVQFANSQGVIQVYATGESVMIRPLALQLPVEEHWRVKDLVASQNAQALRDFVEQRQNDDERPPPPTEMFLLPENDQTVGNVGIIQFVLGQDASIETVLFNGNRESAKSHHEDFDNILNKLKTQFDQKFDSVFTLTSYDKPHQDFAKTSFSNVLGGIGYFSGDSIVDCTANNEEQSGPKLSGNLDDDELELLLFSDKLQETKQEEEPLYEQKKGNPEKVPPQSLYTATPSRSFFPRGFLWDEGFHLLVVVPWDVSLVMEVVKSWMNLMNDDGWIAREQILGEEARSKVPVEFQVQYTHYANPPTLILPVINMLSALKQPQLMMQDQTDQFIASKLGFDYDFSQHGKDPSTLNLFLNQVYPQFKKNFEWYRTTQIGKLIVNGVAVEDAQVYRWRGRTNTHCLTSGLDDYPRGQMSVYELHLDLTCWIAMYADMLQMMAKYLDLQKDVKQYQNIRDSIKKIVNDHFWSEDEQAYGDIEALDADSPQNGMRVFARKGYVSLFPFLFNLIDHKSERLGAVLDMIHDPNQLWSEFGVRSLSQQDDLYGEGENYWRGPIWINMNYLVLRALKLYYISDSGPHSVKAQLVYTQLRQAVVSNIYKNYKDTGHLWEQYNPETGKGQRSHPFTGWTSLVLNIMAEIY